MGILLYKIGGCIPSTAGTASEGMEILSYKIGGGLENKLGLAVTRSFEGQEHIWKEQEAAITEDCPLLFLGCNAVI